MSRTATQVISDAAKLAGVRARGQILDSDLATSYLQYLNEMFGEWVTDGIDYGLDTLTLASVLYLDNNDLSTIRYNLAVKIADDEGAPLRPTIIQSAHELKAALVAKYLNVPEMTLSEALISNDYSYNIEIE